MDCQHTYNDGCGCHACKDAEIAKLREENRKLREMLSHPEGICGRCGWLNKSDHDDWCEFGKELKQLEAEDA